MGPFFVFLSRCGLVNVECLDFPTLEQAQAFYYGVREMIHRDEQSIYLGNRPRYSNTSEIDWITCIMGDVCDSNGIGHYTIYNDTIKKHQVERAINKYLDTASI